MNDLEHQAAVGRAYTATTDAEKEVKRLQERRGRMIADLKTFSGIDPSEIILTDYGKLVDRKAGHTEAFIPEFPSHSELKELLTQLREAEKELAKVQDELHSRERASAKASPPAK